jgi:transposase-like protein
MNVWRRTIMNGRSPSKADIRMAQVCVNCPVCRRARSTQHGIAYSFVKGIEGSLCPFCKAYERVYGKKAHEPRQG